MRQRYANICAGQAAASSKGKAEETGEGAVFNCGGHVAAVDWAPSTPGAQTLYLAVSILNMQISRAKLLKDNAVSQSFTVTAIHLCPILR